MFAVIICSTRWRYACESSNEFSPKDLNDLLANAIGAREYVLKSNIDLVMQDGENTLLGADCAEELVIDGQGTATIAAVEGVDGVYESDTFSKSETVDYGFVFTLENNEVNRSNE